MKKFFVLVFLIFFLFGCTDIIKQDKNQGLGLSEEIKQTP